MKKNIYKILWETLISDDSALWERAAFDITSESFWSKAELLPKGDKFVGSVIDGKPKGKGYLRTAGNAVFAGVFKDGKLDGIGRHVFSDGGSDYCYVGEFRDGKYCGYGVLTVTDILNVTTFEGEFRDGKRIHGVCTVEDSDKGNVKSVSEY